MSKTKLISYFIFSALLTFVFVSSVGAEETKPYYTNSNGATLTEEQYNNLIEVFSENTLYSMSKEQIDIIKNETDFDVSTKTTYIKTTDSYNILGEYTGSFSQAVSENYALNYDPSKEIMPMSWKDSHETSMKKLELKVVTGNSISYKIATITNTWLSIPKVKKFDVIALRPGSKSMTITIVKGLITGYQKADNTMINYDGDSENTKISSSFTNGRGGIGISMNILDAVQNSLENSMTVYFLTGANPFELYGTYQHAAQSTTLAESQDYTFDASGYGGVLKFSNSVKGKYDQMQGVHVSYESFEELYS